MYVFNFLSNFKPFCLVSVPLNIFNVEYFTPKYCDYLSFLNNQIIEFQKSVLNKFSTHC